MSKEELYKKTVIALTVELAEVANCNEFFKHWKDNKRKVDTKRFFPHPTMFYDTQNNDKACSFEEAHHLSLVEECSDCLHFILSIANQVGLEISLRNAFESSDIDSVYLNTVSLISMLPDQFWFEPKVIRNSVRIVIECFLNFCKLLDVTQEELEQAYYEKNKVNYERLANGY